jgi:hypothetical protein
LLPALIADWRKLVRATFLHVSLPAYKQRQMSLATIPGRDAPRPSRQKRASFVSLSRSIPATRQCSSRGQERGRRLPAFCALSGHTAPRFYIADVTAEHLPGA